MSSIMNRLIELTADSSVISVILLGIANHIDNYQTSPGAHGFVQKK